MGSLFHIPDSHKPVMHQKQYVVIPLTCGKRLITIQVIFCNFIAGLSRRVEGIQAGGVRFHQAVEGKRIMGVWEKRLNVPHGGIKRKSPLDQ